MNACRLNLLGGFELRDDAGTLLRLPTRKAQALLAFLALSPGRQHSRDTLAALLWGDVSEPNSRASLRQTLSQIGKSLGRHAIKAEGRAVALAPGALDVDAVKLQVGYRGNALDELTRTAQLYRGELLAGLAMNEPGFEEWLVPERERLRQQAIGVLARLATVLRETGETEQAIQALLRLLAIDPLDEDGHRTLMRLYAAQGRRAAALRQYQVCVGMLQRELDSPPEPQTRALYNELLRDRKDGQASEHERKPLHSAPLFGRADELGCGLRVLDDAACGSGHTVALLGEAGIGKTRLAEELAERATAQGMRVLQGRCFESQQQFPFAPWMDLFRAARVQDDHALLQGLDPRWRVELAELLPELGAGLAARNDDAESMRRHGQLFQAVLGLLGQLADRAPVLLILDDVHWADEFSMKLLATISRRTRKLPMMVLVTLRLEELQALPVLKRTLREIEQDGLLTTLTLQALSKDDTLCLVRTLIRSGEPEQSIVDLTQRVWQASEGNPFVVMESMRAPARGTARPLPGRVRELIQEHFERLGASARRLLAVAAVAGREFDFTILQRASGLREQEASEALEELVRRQLIHCVGDNFDFVHDRIRRVADDNLLPPTRRALHASMAEALEAHHSADLAPAYDRLAHHYCRTDRNDKAVWYLTRFAERAARTGAHLSAIASLDEALAHLARVRGPASEQQRFDLVFRKTRSLLLLGRLGEVVDLLEPEQAVVTATGDHQLRGAFYFRLGAAHVYLGAYVNAERHASLALGEAMACQDATTIGKSHFLLAFSKFWSDPASGVAHGEQAVSNLERANEPWWLGQSLWILGLNLCYRGHLAQGLAMERRARAIGELLDDRRLMSSADWAIGFVSTLTGDTETALSACRQAVALSPDPLTRMITVGMLALAHVERHEPQAAMPLLEEVIPQAQHFRFAQLHGLYLGFLGEASLQMGQVKAAREYLYQAIEATREATYIYGQAWCHRILGRIEQAEGDSAAARTQLALAIELFMRIESQFELGRTHLELGKLLESCADLTGASQHALLALEDFRALRLEPFITHAGELVSRLRGPVRPKQASA